MSLKKRRNPPSLILLSPALKLKIRALRSKLKLGIDAKNVITLIKQRMSNARNVFSGVISPSKKSRKLNLKKMSWRLQWLLGVKFQLKT